MIIIIIISTVSISVNIIPQCQWYNMSVNGSTFTYMGINICVKLVRLIITR
jgi:hypothetical protein